MVQSVHNHMALYLMHGLKITFVILFICEYGHLMLSLCSNPLDILPLRLLISRDNCNRKYLFSSPLLILLFPIISEKMTCSAKSTYQFQEIIL